MFKLAPKNAPFAYDVIIPEVNDTGHIIRHKAKFLFNRWTRTELDDKEQEINELYPVGDGDSSERARQTVERQVARTMLYCAGWKDVVGPNNEPLEFNQENLFDMMNAYPGAYPAIFEAYVKMVFNNGEALLQKN